MVEIYSQWKEKYSKTINNKLYREKCKNNNYVINIQDGKVTYSYYERIGILLYNKLRYVTVYF